MHSITKRVWAILLCLAMVLPLVTFRLPAKVQAAVECYDDYTHIATIKNAGGCTGMQGMAMDNTYLYNIKIASATQDNAFIARTHKDTGSTTYLKNAATGTNYFTELYHANDMEIVTIDGVQNLFVATSLAGTTSLVRYTLSGTTLTRYGSYDTVYNGSSTAISSAQVMSVSSDAINFLIKKGKDLYTATLNPAAKSGEITLTHAFTLDVANVSFGGKVYDLSDYLHQGFDYHDGKIFVPITGDPDMSISTIAVFHADGASGTIRNDPELSVYIQSTAYPVKFEIESCEVCPADGKLYFNTNQQNNSSADYDAVHYVTGFTYDPSRWTSKASSYRWEVVDDQLVSVTTDGNVFNNALIKTGDISGNSFSDVRYSLSKSVIMEHDRPWILEWKSSGIWTDGGLLLSSQANSKYEGNTYIFRRKNSTLIAVGQYSDGTYHNYGLDLATYGVDGNADHVYRMTNNIAPDGSNMIYLSVDGRELGPLDQYYHGGTAQGSTSNWLSGEDFTFSYMGTDLHPLDECTIDYIQFWPDGTLSQQPAADTHRWGSGLAATTGTGLTGNASTLLAGSTSGNTHDASRFSLEEEVVLLHDRSWTIEWEAEGTWIGGALLLSSARTSKTVNAPFLFRSPGSSFLGFGYFDGSSFQNYGLKLSDYGIDGTALNTYRLDNRIHADGSNMVYLTVGGKELGPLNQYFIGTNAQGTTDNWICGKDFTFSYLGTVQHDITATISYLQVWENGKQAEHQPQNYRWEPGSNHLTSMDGFTPNQMTTLSGTITSGAFSGAVFQMEKPVVLRHDLPWSIQWASEGSWKDNANGTLLLCNATYGSEIHSPYLYRRGNSEIIAFGERRDGYHQNYGIQLSDYGIDGTAYHTYRLENRIHSDGSNMVYLYVDDVELGAMVNHFKAGNAQNTTSNWISGKDFEFSYVGNPDFTIGEVSIDYLQINEGCNHSYHAEITTKPTCTATGETTYTCSGCGDSYTETIPAIAHSYDAVVTEPTCTAGGYTTYTCSACGDKYTGNETAATGHNFVNGSCTDCGESCDHSWNQGSCTVCGMACTHNWVNGTCTACGQVCSHKWFGGKCTECNMAYPQKDYYLFGYINGRDYACNDDYLNLGEYKFVNGKLTAIFTENSYVALKSGDNQDWYMSYNYVDAGIAAATLFNTNTGAGEKLFVPGGKIITFTLVSNGDDSFTLSYTARDCTHDSHGQDGICTTCGASVSHSYQTVTNDATCTAAGSKVHTCTVCGYSYCETISATGHSYGSWTQTKAPTCTESGELKRTCSGCGDVQTQSIATTDHSYVDGTCTNCGAADPDAPSVIVPTLNLDHPSLSFEGEIMYNLYFTADDLTSVVEMGLISFNEKLESGTIENADNIYPGYITAGSLYMGQSEGVPARYLGDAVYFKAYAKLSDGSYVYSGIAGYNAAVYAKSILKNSTNDYMKRLVVAMINYGAEAQGYFCGKEGVEYTPMNNFLTADQQALINAYDASMVADLISVDSSKIGMFTYNTGDFTKRSNSVSFDGAFAINYYFTAKGTPDNGMKFYYWNTADYLSADVLAPENATGSMDMVAGSGNQYWSQVSGIAAKEVDHTYFVAGVYELDGVTYTTGILAYSLGKYCAKLAAGTTEQQALSAATAVYGYYAKEYFSNI